MAAGGVKTSTSRDGVTTVAGDGTNRSLEGFGTEASLSSPAALMPSNDGKSLIFSEGGSHRIRRFDFADGRVSKLCGSEKGFKNGDSNSAAFQYPRALCFDPLKPNNMFIGDYSSIRYWDSATDQITLIAGDEKTGYADGVGTSARFYGISSLLCHPNGKTLFVSDQGNNRIRGVDLPSESVTTIAGDGKKETRDGIGVQCSLADPRRIVFDRSPNVRLNSVLLIASTNRIRRFDTQTRVATTIDLPTLKDFNPLTLAYTPNGYLLVSCHLTHVIYSINLVTAEVTRVAGSGRKGFVDGPVSDAEFRDLCELTVVDHEQCLYASETENHCIRRISLSSRLGLFEGTRATLRSGPLPADVKVITLGESVRDGVVSTVAGDDSSHSRDGIGRAPSSVNSPPLQPSELEAGLKSVWAELARMSPLLRVENLTIPVPAVGENAMTVKVLATKELKQLTSKLESLLTRSGADQNETKALIKRISDDVLASTTDGKTSAADVKSDIRRSSADVKDSNSEVISTLQSIVLEFKSKSRDPELVRALAAVEYSAREAKLAAEWKSERAKLEDELTTVKEREKSISDRLTAAESRAAESTSAAAVAADAAERRYRETVLAGEAKTTELESRLRVTEQQLQNIRDRHSERLKVVTAARAKLDAALKVAAADAAERASEFENEELIESRLQALTDAHNASLETLNAKLKASEQQLQTLRDREIALTRELNLERAKTTTAAHHSALAQSRRNESTTTHRHQSWLVFGAGAVVGAALMSAYWFVGVRALPRPRNSEIVNSISFRSLPD